MVDGMQAAKVSLKVNKRVAGVNNIRLDGISDLVLRAKGKTVFDIGCNRGMVGYQFAENYASVVHGCDRYEDGIKVAREVFSDPIWGAVQSQFEVVDLTEGPRALKIFEMNGYDIILCLAVYHKLKRQMPPDKLTELMVFFGNWTKKYFAWRATSDKPVENEEEIKCLDRDLKVANLKRIHTSYISNDLGVAAIWARD